MKRWFRLLMLVLIAGLLWGQMGPAQGQDGGTIQYRWNVPLNSGAMPQNAPYLPPAFTMPVLPLTEPLVPETLFFNIESFSDQYTVMNVTLDTVENRFFAFNISYRYGIHPISPNGQYGIFTVPDGATEVVTCGILDLLTLSTVDQFQTTGGCNQNNLWWSPDSSKLLFQTTDEQGHGALAIRQDASNAVFRPIPSTDADLGDIALDDSTIFTPRGWINNDLFAFEVVTRGIVSETLFAKLIDPRLATPSTRLLYEDTLQRLITSRPAQSAGDPHRGVVLTDVITGSSFSVAPFGHMARVADVAPDDSRVVYWSETKTQTGTTHPLRLVVYNPDSDEQTVLLQFDGPTDSFLLTRPGVLVWNNDAIYFYISQQDGAASRLQSGTYRIQPDGSNLEFVTPALLWASLPSAR